MRILRLRTATTGTSSSTTSTTATPSTPKRGGSLRVALTGGASSDTVDAQLLTNFLDQARLIPLYDAPVMLNTNAQFQLSLAEELTPNTDATAWTMRVRPGMTFHNGKPLTADDIIFSFQRIMDPKEPEIRGAPALAPRLQAPGPGRRADGQIPLHLAFLGLLPALSDFNYFIVPVGYNVKHPIGTGPFKFESFTPGEQSIFMRNENYWDGAPMSTRSSSATSRTRPAR